MIFLLPLNVLDYDNCGRVEMTDGENTPFSRYRLVIGKVPVRSPKPHQHPFNVSTPQQVGSGKRSRSSVRLRAISTLGGGSTLALYQEQCVLRCESITVHTILN
jgi:hypothetical protein